VILHVRRSADALLAGCAASRWPAASPMPSTAAGSRPSAVCRLGFRLGFGGAMTFERALQIRRLAATCPPTRWCWRPTRRTSRRLAVPQRGAARQAGQPRPQ
jgi:TatD DNase family protein